MPFIFRGSRVPSRIDIEEPSGEQECGKLIVNDLSFGYNGADILQSITFSASKGQVIGITGAVGSGKTSLAHELTGLYPYKGSFTLDSQELSNIAPNERNRFIAYTGHEQFLFSMSIRDNICLSSQEDSVLEKALEATAKKEDIARFD